MINSPFHKKDDFLESENGTGIFEVQSGIRRISDDKPCHLGISILQHSKLLFLQFFQFLNEHLESGRYQLLYADTDSLSIALTKSEIPKDKSLRASV